MLYLFISVFVILFIGSILLFFLKRQKKQFGILAGNRIYQDTQQMPGETLYAKSIPLIGKPDYLIKENNVIIPVEFKSGKTPMTPYENHTMQLMAYCWLVEEHFGKKPPGGFLRYPEKEFKIAYTDEAKKSIKILVAEILECKKTNKELHCKHQGHYLG